MAGRRGERARRIAARETEFKQELQARFEREGIRAELADRVATDLVELWSTCLLISQPIRKLRTQRGTDAMVDLQIALEVLQRRLPRLRRRLYPALERVAPTVFDPSERPSDLKRRSRVRSST